MTISEWYLKMRDGVSGAMDRIGAGVNSASSKLTAMQLKTEALERKMSSAGRSGDLLQNSLRGVALAAGLSLSVSGLSAMASSLLDTTLKAEGYQRALKLIEGGNVQAGKTFSYLKDTANQYGASFSSISEGYKMIGAASRGTELAGKGAREILEGVTAASVALGIGQEESKGALLAISQMISKGKVSAEELRGQLGERLPGAFQVAARAMNMTTGELDKLISKGDLSASEFLPRFAAQLKKEFQSGAEEASGSLQALKNRMENTFLFFRMELAEKLAPHFAKAFEKITQFFESNKAQIMTFMEDVIGSISKLGGYVAQLFKFLYDHSTLVKTLIAIYAAWKVETLLVNGALKLNKWYTSTSTLALIANGAAVMGVKGAWDALSIAMRLNPWGFALAGLAAVAAAAALLYDKISAGNKELDEMMAKQIQLEKDTNKEIFNTELQRVNDLIAGYKGLSEEKARAAAISAEIEVLRKKANTIALEPLVNGMMTPENKRKYNNIMTALAAVRSEDFMQSLMGSGERLYGLKNTPAGPTPPGTDPKLKSGIDSVTSGGKQVRNYNVTIGSLVKELNIRAETVKEGAQDMKRMVEEYLLRALQGAEIATANG
jgi:tape measure domain-containing protein